MSSDAAQFDLEKFLPYRLSVAANRVSRRFAERYGRRFGLTIPEWRVMAVLGRYGRLAAREVTARTAMDKVKVSRAVQALTARCMLARAVDDEDARVQWLALTEAGRTVHDAIVPLAGELEAEVLEGLSAAEAKALRRALARIAERFEGEGVD
jgi:DNA-binding MarR family transcriptional regulator